MSTEKKVLAIFIYVMLVSMSIFAIDVNKIVNKPKVYTIVIHEEITDKLINKVIPIIGHTERGDIIILDLNSPGGSLETTMEIIKLLKEDGSIIKIKIGAGAQAASGAAVLALAGIKNGTDLIDDTASIMFHTPYIPGICALGDGIYGVPVRLGELTYKHIHELNEKFNLEKLLGNTRWEKYISGIDIVLTGKKFKDRIEITY